MVFNYAPRVICYAPNIFIIQATDASNRIRTLNLNIMSQFSTTVLPQFSLDFKTLLCDAKSNFKTTFGLSDECIFTVKASNAGPMLETVHLVIIL